MKNRKYTKKHIFHILFIFILSIPLITAQEIPSTATIGGSAVKIGMNILNVLVVLIGAIALLFVSRTFFGYYKRKKNYKIDAVIFNRDGTWYTKKIGKFRTKDNLDKMLFQGSNETMPVIGTENIRSNKVVLWRYAPGQYAVIPPRIWEKTTPEKFGIEVINMQAKNFAFLEQRAAVSRWAYIRDAFQRFAPYLTMLILVILTGVAIWFLIKLGNSIYTDAINARIVDCHKLIGGGS